MLPLLPHLRGVKRYAEPCAGNRKLIYALHPHGLTCIYANDIQWDQRGSTWSGDAIHYGGTLGIDAIITNPPWYRDIMHELIAHFQCVAPTWLLIDSDWMHTRQAIRYLDSCSHIVSIGRVKWIPDSQMTGKDNACWYRFYNQHTGGPHFYPKRLEEHHVSTSQRPPAVDARSPKAADQGDRVLA